jgi:hypothetical protein
MRCSGGRARNPASAILGFLSVSDLVSTFRCKVIAEPRPCSSGDSVGQKRPEGTCAPRVLEQPFGALERLTIGKTGTEPAKARSQQ